MQKKWLEKIEGKELKLFSIASVFILLVISVLSGTLNEIAEGMGRIIISRDALITDYFELAGYSAAFFNAFLVMGMGVILVISLKVPFTGLTMAVLFINAGYAFWGKNPINIIPILFGTYLHARVHKSGLNRYIYTALFGTCLAPLVTEIIYIFPFPRAVNFLLAIGIGIFIGFILPPLAMHTASMHMGYNLFNVGFAAGMLAFVMVSVLKSVGIESSPVLIWKEGGEGVSTILYAFFLFTILYGVWINQGKLSGIKKILRHPGRAVADFVLMDGVGTTLMNMGIIGSVGVTYILFIGGDFSGPVVGSILCLFGFAGFGVHIKNYIPVLVGVYLSTFFTNYTVDEPAMQLAAILSAALSPIAGQFGIVAGIVAGILHAIIVMCTAPLYGGLNLYNNGFSAGWVAIVMVPVWEGFMKHYKKGRV